ncbi:MAG: hypothetical protein ACOX6N_03415 [Patescibacteria group bacterium]
MISPVLRSVCSLITLLLLLIVVSPRHLYAADLEGNGTSESPYRIESCQDLRIIAEDIIYFDKHFVLTQNIDCSETASWYQDGLENYLGFNPIGNSDNPLPGL